MNLNENTKQRKLLLLVLDRGMIAFIVPQVFTAWAYIRLVDIFENPIQIEYKTK